MPLLREIHLILYFSYRHPSGNNNEDSRETTVATSDMNNSVIKSQSLPNLYRRKLMSSSINSAALSNSTVRKEPKLFSH